MTAKRFPRSIRPRIQRAFFQWWHSRKARFAVPLHVVIRRNDCLELGVIGLTPLISITLTWEICVAVDWSGQCWDLLLALETLPSRTPNGYVCEMCKAEDRTVYPSREALWIDELFEPFLELINNELANASWLALYQSVGATWATLENAADEKAIHCVPVWVADSEGQMPGR
ncbi:MAG: hypothetical protein FIA97_15060 [Methylococcaceae bacterium]|nr:hypothetical protein [Methylococcaceae bacterium]